jgi:hypothetical protein
MVKSKTHAGASKGTPTHIKTHAWSRTDTHIIITMCVSIYVCMCIYLYGNLSQGVPGQDKAVVNNKTTVNINITVTITITNICTSTYVGLRLHLGIEPRVREGNGPEFIDNVNTMHGKGNMLIVQHITHNGIHITSQI